MGLDASKRANLHQHKNSQLLQVEISTSHIHVYQKVCTIITNNVATYTKNTGFLSTKKGLRRQKNKVSSQ